MVDLFQFLQRQSFHFLQDEQDAIVLRDGGEQFVREITNASLLLFLFAGATTRDSVCQHHLLFREIGEAGFVTPSPLSEVIQSGVDSKAIKPGIEPLRSAELVEGKIKPDKDLLGNIFDIFGPADETGDSSQYSPPVRCDDFVESRIIAVLRSFDEV